MLNLVILCKLFLSLLVPMFVKFIRGLYGAFFFFFKLLCAFRWPADGHRAAGIGALQSGVSTVDSCSPAYCERA